MLTLIKGFAGKPSHAPLTDVSIGAYTVGVLMLLAGYFGLEEEAMAKGSLLAISGGLLVAVPTTLTGLLDWADLAKGSRARTLATYHLVVMALATATFAATWVLQRPGYLDSEVTTGGLVAGCAALGLLTVGGTLGGALAYVYGVRVVKQDVALADALIPGRISEPGQARTGAGAAKAKKAKRVEKAAPVVVAAAPAPEPATTVQETVGTKASPGGFDEAMREYERLVLAQRAGSS